MISNARSEVAAALSSRQPTSPIERFYMSVVLFALAFNLPHTWLASRADRSAATAGDALSTAFFILALGLPLIRLSGGWRRIGLALGAFPAFWFFVLVVPSSVFWSADPGTTMKRALGFLVATAFGLYLFARCPAREFIMIVSRSLMAGALVNLVWGFTFVFTDGSVWGGVWALKNTLGAISGLSVMFLLLAAASVPRRRVFFGLGAVVAAFLLYKSTSGTALVGTFLVVVLLLVYNALRGKRTLYGAVIVGLSSSVALAFLAATANLAFLTGLIGKNPTLTGRTLLWSRVLDEISANPLFGYGHDAFWGGFGSPAHQIWIEFDWHPPSGHNLILDSLLDLGLVGTIPFVILIVQALIASVRYVRDNRGASALLPLGFLSYVLLFSMTETGPVGRTIAWVTFTYVIATLGEEKIRLTNSDRVLGPRTLQSSRELIRL